jgi:hypothetical protein
MSKIYIKPATPGSKVHLEGKAREFLPEEGAEVERSVYWVRRINDGSVVEGKRPAKPATSKE